MPRRALPKRKVRIDSTIDPALLADIDARALELERTRSEIIREALRMWLEYQKQEAEVDRNLARLAEERMADTGDDWVAHEDVKGQVKL